MQGFGQLIHVGAGTLACKILPISFFLSTQVENFLEAPQLPTFDVKSMFFSDNPEEGPWTLLIKEGHTAYVPAKHIVVPVSYPPTAPGNDPLQAPLARIMIFPHIHEFADDRSDEGWEGTAT